MKYNGYGHGMSCPNRRSIRLKGYDYSRPGAYFITIVTQDRECLFGAVVDGIMYLNDAGCMVWECWRMIPQHFPNVQLDAFIVMPNHVHGIIVITDDEPTNDSVGATHASPLRVDSSPLRVDSSPLRVDSSPRRVDSSPLRMHASPRRELPRPAPNFPCGPKRRSIGAVVGSFKSAASKHIHAIPEFADVPIWQRNYYEHIIRDDESMDRIREYIVNNPLKWTLDHKNPTIIGATHASPQQENQP